MSYYFARVLIILLATSEFDIAIAEEWSTNLHKVKVHHSRDLCLDCLHSAISVRERPGVTIEGDLHLITCTSVREEK